MADDDRPHLPGRAPIDAYGNGGFRFADMSHQGSLLILPDGMYAWPVSLMEDVTLSRLLPVLETAGQIEFFLLGTGAEQIFADAAMRSEFEARHIGLECMNTGAAVRTYNVLLAEQRTFAAAFIAVDTHKQAM